MTPKLLLEVGVELMHYKRTKGKILYLNLTQTFWCESAAQDGQLCLWPVNGPYLRPSHVSITNADW